MYPSHGYIFVPLHFVPYRVLISTLGFYKRYKFVPLRYSPSDKTVCTFIGTRLYLKWQNVRRQKKLANYMETFFYLIFIKVLHMNNYYYSFNS